MANSSERRDAETQIINCLTNKKVIDLPDGHSISFNDKHDSAGNVILDYTIDPEDYSMVYDVGELQSRIREAFKHSTIKSGDYLLDDAGQTGNEQSWEEIYDETQVDKPIESNVTFYLLWSEPINEVSMDAVAPVCGVTTSVTQESQTNPPDVTLAEGGHYEFYGYDESSNAYWIKNDTEFFRPEAFSGTFAGGNTYYYNVIVTTEFGYYFSDNVSVVANGKQAKKQTVVGSHNILAVIGAVTAVHDWSDTWATSTEPTVIAEGTKTRQCKHYSTCSGIETEMIEKVTYSTASGDGNVWTKGSSSTADFRFVRSFESATATAYNKFTGIQVDGKTVSAGNYTKEQGSVIVKLKPAYLETLSTGGHTITALFETVSGTTGKASANFTIKNKSSSGGSSTPSKKTDNVVTCQMAGYPANYAWNEAAKACQPGYLDAGGNFHPYNTARRSTPNTSDNGNLTMYAMAMFLMTFVAYIAAKKLTEDSRA